MLQIITNIHLNLSSNDFSLIYLFFFILKHNARRGLQRLVNNFSGFLKRSAHATSVCINPELSSPQQTEQNVGKKTQRRQQILKNKELPTQKVDTRC